MSVTLIGLKSCDSCRKARAWLDWRGNAHAFRDLRADAPTRAELTRWIAAHGDWEVFLNRRGTTWRGLADAAKRSVDERKAIRLITTHPALMKRPVIVVEQGGETTVTVGFDADVRGGLQERLG